MLNTDQPAQSQAGLPPSLAPAGDTSASTSAASSRARAPTAHELEVVERLFNRAKSTFMSPNNASRFILRHNRLVYFVGVKHGLVGNHIEAGEILERAMPSGTKDITEYLAPGRLPADAEGRTVLSGASCTELLAWAKTNGFQVGWEYEFINPTEKSWNWLTVTLAPEGAATPEPQHQ